MDGRYDIHYKYILIDYLVLHVQTESKKKLHLQHEKRIYKFGKHSFSFHIFYGLFILQQNSRSSAAYFSCWFSEKFTTDAIFTWFSSHYFSAATAEILHRKKEETISNFLKGKKCFEEKMSDNMQIGYLKKEEWRS